MKIIEKNINVNNGSWNYCEDIIINNISYRRYNIIDNIHSLENFAWYKNGNSSNSVLGIIDDYEQLELEKIYKQDIRSQKLNNILNENY
jgi:hypothetical protein